MKGVKILLTPEEWGIIKDFVLISEEMASSDPEMPSHADTEKRFDELLEKVKKLIS